MPPSEIILFEWFKRFSMLNILRVHTLNLYSRLPTSEEINEMFDIIEKNRNKIISKITFPYLKAGWIKPSSFLVICPKCNHLNPKKAKRCLNCGKQFSSSKRINISN
jgi:hypothetical protein